MISMMTRRALPLAAAVALVLMTPARAADGNAVTIDDFRFSPATLTVPVGGKVTWTNRDDEPHTVLAAEPKGLFKSPPLDTGDSFSFTFDKPGTYKYFCSVHPHMTGVIVVN